MDKLRAAVAYVKAFHQHDPHLSYLAVCAVAGAWFRSGQPVEVATAWYDKAFTPVEALPNIAAGITPEMAAEAADALVEEHGVVGAVALQLALEHPGATLLVDPDAEAAITAIDIDPATDHVNTVLDLLGPPPGDELN